MIKFLKNFLENISNRKREKEDYWFIYYPEMHHKRVFEQLMKKEGSREPYKNYYGTYEIEFSIHEYVEYALIIKGERHTINYSLLEYVDLKNIIERLEAMIELVERPSGLAVLIWTIVDCGIPKEHIILNGNESVTVVLNDDKKVTYGVVSSPSYDSLKLIREELKAIS